MSCLKILGAVVVIAGVSACREPASTTTTTSATTTAPTAGIATPTPERAAEPTVYRPMGMDDVERDAPAQAPAPTEATPAAPPAGTSASANEAAASSAATAPAERPAPVAAPIFPRGDVQRAPYVPPRTENPASMYGYDRATGGAMRPGAASNPNTTSGADPRR